MEQEFKWTAGRTQFDRLCATLPLLGGETLTEMRAVYYDTPDHLLRRRRIGLRLRQENGMSVCCMKLRGTEQATDGLHAHAEYECPAATIEAGLAALPAQGADRALCASLAQAGLQPIAKTAFLRLSRMVMDSAYTAELSFDQGTLAANGHEEAFTEIECEFKSGDPAAFRTACEALARAYALTPQPLSKLARALALADVQE